MFWLNSDVAVLSEDDYLQIVGRIKDMIIRGGENIYPVEVEEFLHKHPKIADVQVSPPYWSRDQFSIAYWMLRSCQIAVSLLI